eukprot:8258305-Alexandrium_andersonii.AAC.1
MEILSANDIDVTRVFISQCLHKGGRQRGVVDPRGHLGRFNGVQAWGHPCFNLGRKAPMGFRPEEDEPP